MQNHQRVHILANIKMKRRAEQGRVHSNVSSLITVCLNHKISPNAKRKKRTLFFHPLPGIHFWVKITGLGGKQQCLREKMTHLSLHPSISNSLLSSLLVTSSGHITYIAEPHWEHGHQYCVQHAPHSVPRTDGADCIKVEGVNIVSKWDVINCKWTSCFVFF